MEKTQRGMEMAEHTLKINITEGDKIRLFDLLGRYGVSASELFENVVLDLVGAGNGSDEREMSREWFERVWMDPEETLLKYCLEYGYDIDDVVTAWDENEYYKQSGVSGSKPEWVEEDLHEYLDDYKEKHPNANIEREIRTCKLWLEEREHF